MTNTYVSNNISNGTSSIFAGCILTSLMSIASPQVNAGLYNTYPANVNRCTRISSMTPTSKESAYKAIKFEEEPSLEVLFIQTYEKMLKESKPLDRDITQLISDNIFDLF